MMAEEKPAAKRPTADHKRRPGAEQRLERHSHVLAVGNGDAGVAVDVRGSADEDGPWR